MTRFIVLCYLAVFCVALVVRLVSVAFLSTEPTNDLYWNDIVGWNLSQGNGFTADTTPPFRPSVFRTPGYPAFLACVYSVCGHSYQSVYYSQALIDAGSAILLGLIIRFFATEIVAVITSALYAVYPYSAAFCGVLHQDVLLVFAILTLAVLLAYACRHDTFLSWLLAGTAFGAVLLIKNVYLLYALQPALTVLFIAPRVKHKTRALAISSIATLAVVLPWIARNYVQFGAFPPLAAGGSGMDAAYVLDELDSNARSRFSRLRDSTSREMTREEYLQSHKDGVELIEQEAVISRKYRSELVRRWPEYTMVMIEHVPRLWITQGSIRHSQLTSYFAQALSWALLLPGLAGMAVALKDFRRLLPLYLVVLVITFMHVPFHVEARYTLPARPFMIFFAAVALVAFGRLLRRLLRPHETCASADVGVPYAASR